MAEDTKGIFISYRRGDATAYAGWLADTLGNLYGKQIVFSSSRLGRRTMSSMRSDLLHLLLEGRDTMAPASCGLLPAMRGSRPFSDPAYTGNLT